MKKKFDNIMVLTIGKVIGKQLSSWMKEYKTKTDPRSWHLWKLSEVTYSTIIFFKCTVVPTYFKM